MKKEKAVHIEHRSTLVDCILESPVGTLVFGILGICFGIFFIWINCLGTEPITREAAAVYSGAYESYSTYKGSLTLKLADDTSFFVGAYRGELEEKLEDLSKGEQLWILLNPASDNVLEIKTASQEILNFDEAQEMIISERNGYIGIGIFVCLGGVFLIGYALLSASEEKRAKLQEPAVIPLRPADMTVKCRVLLEAQVKGYSVCYRRVKTVNELVIDGQVYAERKGFLEPAYKLQARKGGNLIEAGLNESGFSFIRLNGKCVKRKRRWF